MLEHVLLPIICLIFLQTWLEEESFSILIYLVFILLHILRYLLGAVLDALRAYWQESFHHGTDFL